MNIIGLDWETYYDRVYSLSKMSTRDYIMDPQFEAIGLAITPALDADPIFIDQPNIEAALAAIDWSRTGVVAHNMAFDGAILKWRYGVTPAMYFDTMLMAMPAVRPVTGSVSLARVAAHLGLGKKGDEVVMALGKRRRDFVDSEIRAYASYCRQDVKLMMGIFKHLAAELPAEELRIIDLTLRMYLEPRLTLNKQVLETYLRDHEAELKALLDRAGIYDPKVLRSDAQFATLLQTLGVDPPTKISLRTGKRAYAFAKTDPGFKALLDHPNDHVAALAAARAGHKTSIVTSRTNRLIDIAERYDDLAVPLRYYAAHTGRYGGCLTADTVVTVLDPAGVMMDKYIVDVAEDDLVWDGEEFVAHEGVVFSGYAEVIEWDGVKGTEDHVVFTDVGEISLGEAYAGGHHLQVPRRPGAHDVDLARAAPSSVKV